MLGQAQLQNCDEYPFTERKIYVSPARLDTLFHHIKQKKFLLLYGLPNSGKKTLGICLIRKWLGEQRVRLVRFLECDRQTDFGDPQLSPKELKRANQSRGGVLYGFFDCADKLCQVEASFEQYLGEELLTPYRDELNGLYILLTVSNSAQNLSKNGLFRWAQSKGFAVEVRADEGTVREILDAAERPVQELSEHFRGAFADESGDTANLQLVNEFLQSEQTISQFRQQRVGRRANGSADHCKDLQDLIERELDFVDRVCVGVSGRKLDALFAPRTVIPWHPSKSETPELEAAPEGNSGARSWRQVVQEKGAIILLSDYGLGKTVQLLHEVRQHCLQRRLNLASNDLDAAFYIRASTLAEHLSRTQQDLPHGLVELIAERHGGTSESFKIWLRSKLEAGEVFLAVDALDEIPATKGRTTGLREILALRVTEYLRKARSATVLFSARRTSYESSLLSDAEAWLLQPFTPSQLKRASDVWFREGPDLAKIFRAAYDIPPVQELLQIPILFMLAASHLEEASRTGSAPTVFSRRCDFFDSCLAQIRRRWVERTASLADQPNRMQENQFIPFLQDFAWRVWSHDPNRTYFLGSQISQFIEAAEKPQTLASRSDLLADICESGVLRLEREAGDPLWAFLHRTILEFLAASYLAQQANVSSDAAKAVISKLRPYFPDDRASVLLWMVAGKLNYSAALVAEIVDWAKTNLEGFGDAPLIDSPRLAELLADCLFEASRSALPPEVRTDALDVIARGLDRVQRRMRSKGREQGVAEWKELGDWTLAYRALAAAEIHEGVTIGAREILGLMGDFRRTAVQRTQGGMIPADAIAEALPRLRRGINSSCSVVRWAAVWVAGALVSRGRTEIAEIRSEVETLISDDRNAAVRSIALRSLVQFGHPKLELLLTSRLNGPDRPLAASAAVALGRIATPGAVAALKLVASALLLNVDLPRDPLPAAVLGSLEAIVHKSRNSDAAQLKMLLQDESLGELFIRALLHPNPFVQASAASALGKMRYVKAAPSLKAILEAGKERAAPNLRASACFAYQQLIGELADPELRGDLDLFRRFLADVRETPELRRPAASALGALARRGYHSREGIQALLLGLQDYDVTLAKSSLFALTRFPPELVLHDLTYMLSNFERIHDIAYDVAGQHPSQVGLELLLWLIKNSRRPTTVASSLYALESTLTKTHELSAALVGDRTLVGRINEACLRCLSSNHREIVTNAVSALGPLQQMKQFSKSKEYSAFRVRLLAEARVLLRDTDEDVQSGTCYLLGGIGVAEDAERMALLERESSSEKVRRIAHRSRQHLLRRLVPRRE